MPGISTGSTHERVLQLLAEYCHLVDTRLSDEWSELFAADGLLTFGDRRVEGRDALRAFAAASPSGVHLTASPCISHSGEELMVRSAWSFVRGDGTRISAGHYVDRIVDDGQTLQFRHRDVISMASLAVAP